VFDNIYYKLNESKWYIITFNGVEDY